MKRCLEPQIRSDLKEKMVFVEDRRPRAFIECKWSDAEISRGLKYLKARFSDCEACQVSAVGKKDYISADGIRVIPAADYLKRLI